MVIGWDRIEPWNYIVQNVAHEYHKRYDMVELDDIRQALYEWFAEHPRNLTEWEALGEKDSKNLIYRSLRNRALDYCQYWKAKSIGYEISDLFYYDPDVVEALLPSVLRGEITVMPVLNLGKTGKPPAPAEGGNMMAMMTEIDSAYHKLNVDDRRVLFYRYAESMDFGAIASEMDITSEDAVRMRHNRAIKKLITRIGGYRPFLDRDSPEPVSESPDEIEYSEDEENDEQWDKDGSESDQDTTEDVD
jgi:DNA-directed RNA polymerase specialized sigma24 family protein